jgi:hypothetical protein
MSIKENRTLLNKTRKGNKIEFFIPTAIDDWALNIKLKMISGNKFSCISLPHNGPSIF